MNKIERAKCKLLLDVIADAKRAAPSDSDEVLRQILSAGADMCLAELNKFDDKASPIHAFLRVVGGNSLMHVSSTGQLPANAQERQILFGYLLTLVEGVVAEQLAALN